MNEDWHKFLSGQSAQIEDGVVQHFGDLTAELIAARDSTVLCDLSQLGTLKVNGEDAQKFLQSILSNDINSVSPSTAQLSSLNNAKGRLIATFLIWQQGTDYMLQLPMDMCEPMQKKLSMYVLRSKATVDDVSNELVGLGIAGPNAASLLQQYLGIALEQDLTATQQGQTTTIRIAANRFLVYTSAEQAVILWRNISSGARVCGPVCWDWLSIRAGLPAVTTATQEQFVLQMANLDILGGVSFKKGCYPGQEIVARTHYLGKQKRRMYIAHVDVGSAHPPAAGNELYSEEAPYQACGMVMNASVAPEGGYDLLAVVQISSHDAQHVHLHTETGPLLKFLPMPYAIPQEE